MIPKLSLSFMVNSSYGFKHFFSGRYEAEIVGDRIICKGEKDKIEITDEIIFEPQEPDNESFLIRDVIIGVKFHWERKEKQRFTHSLKLVRDAGKITAINIVPIEKYLMSVISSEMSAKCALQMLKATAVVSRSWLLAQIEKSKSIKSDKTEYSTSYKTDDELIKWYDKKITSCLMFAQMIIVSVTRALLNDFRCCKKQLSRQKA
jgi:hypothetical protein